MASQIIADAGQLAASMKELLSVQRLIADRGGSGNGRVPMLLGNAERLENMVFFYHRDMR